MYEINAMKNVINNLTDRLDTLADIVNQQNQPPKAFQIPGTSNELGHWSENGYSFEFRNACLLSHDELKLFIKYLQDSLDYFEREENNDDQEN